MRNRVNVLQSDLESGLAGFESGSFDYVILSQTLQAVRHTEQIIGEMLRVGREGIVTFPNFGYWGHRLQVLRGPHAGVPDPALPVVRHAQRASVHALRDFEAFCADHGMRILERVVMDRGRSDIGVAQSARLAGGLSLRPGPAAIASQPGAGGPAACSTAESAWTRRRAALREVLFTRRMLICVFTGFSSGLPLYVLLTLVPAGCDPSRWTSRRSDCSR